MRLDIRVVTAEQFACAIACQVFYNIDAFAAAIVAFARITFRIFICQRRSHRFHDRGRYKVLGRNQFYFISLPVCFQLNRLGYLRVDFSDFICRIHRIHPFKTQNMLLLYNFITHFTIGKFDIVIFSVLWYDIGKMEVHYE